MHIVVTGGAGFLGQHFVAECAQRNVRVSVLDLKPPRVPLVDLDDLCHEVRFGVDVTRPDSLRGAFDGADVVVHMAGLVSFWRKHRDALMDVNVSGTRHVVNECLNEQVSQFLHVSSVAAIGFANHPYYAIDESFVFDWRLAQGKHYMLSKHLAEDVIRAIPSHQLRWCIANPGLMWGPGDLVNSAALIEAVRAQRVFAWPPGGTNIIDVRDVARGLLAIILRGRPAQRYILGGVNIPLRDVILTIARQLRVLAPARPLPRLLRHVIYWATHLNESLRSAPPRLTADHVDSSFLFRYFSSAKAIAELEWLPRISFEETVKDTIRWLQEHGHSTLQPDHVAAENLLTNAARPL